MIDDEDSSASANAMADAISVAQVLSDDADMPCTLLGYVVVSGGVATVSDLLAESFPPQPGGSWIAIENPASLQLASTENFDSTEWTPSMVSVRGRRIGDSFVVSDPQSVHGTDSTSWKGTEDE